MTAKESLSWGLVVPTYQREKVLPLCLKRAVEQTRKPTEIIVIDASDNWENTRDKVMLEIASTSPEIRWVYTCAEQRSSTVQRNQGLQLATADIVFLLDDDSLMEPTCAEEIMRVYEADTERVVKGVQANDAEHPPADVVINDSKKQGGWSEDRQTSHSIIRSLLGDVVMNWLWSNLVLANAEQAFIPYDDDFPKHQIPAAVKKLHVDTLKLFHGYKMTFRRDAVLQEIFEPSFRYYAADEDLDTSYRVSRHGPLLVALDAKIYHFQSAGGRIPRLKVSALRVLNQAFCLRKYSTTKRYKQLFYRKMARRILAETLKDTLCRRWSLPQVRGVLVALKYSRKIFALQDLELGEWYVCFQREFLESNRLVKLTER